MADFKRYVSYVHRYINGTKDSNIGFVKLEAKSGEVKLSINLKCIDIKNSSMTLNMFCRDVNNDIILYEIDKIDSYKEEYSNVYKTTMSNVFESGRNINDICGIIIIINTRCCLVTQWDDKEINLNKIIKGEYYEEVVNTDVKKNEDYNIEMEENVNVLNDNKIEVESNKIKENVPEEIENTENYDIKNTSNKKQDYEEVILNFNKFNESKIVNYSLEQKEKKVREADNFVKKLFNNFPGMYPFEDDEILECIKFEPHDIGLFSMDKWPLANNSFLLHGYYTYRHLIFAKMKSGNMFKYILGVPGIFRDREKFMAHMFGFRGFKGVRNKPLGNGEFGYWYLEIKL